MSTRRMVQWSRPVEGRIWQEHRSRCGRFVAERIPRDTKYGSAKSAADYRLTSTAADGRICIHGAKSTRVVKPRSPRDRARIVRETAEREGWAYATALSGPGVRVVTDAVGVAFKVGDTHMALDAYEKDA